MSQQDKGILESAGEKMSNLANATGNTISNAAGSVRDTLFGKPEEEKDLGDKAEDAKKEGKNMMDKAGEKIENAGRRVQREAH